MMVKVEYVKVEYVKVEYVKVEYVKVEYKNETCAIRLEMFESI